LQGYDIAVAEVEVKADKGKPVYYDEIDQHCVPIGLVQDNENGAHKNGNDNGAPPGLENKFPWDFMIGGYPN